MSSSESSDHEKSSNDLGTSRVASSDIHKSPQGPQRELYAKRVPYFID
ncbi:3620_t:CDS:2 [Paraglomus brasilianum]|uniref:3620_t:CDS:1 n=1 Tax=Paraglomus brasilianum TaxID=144538 RepID=A0A9N8W9X6_9GLOM|nr:3620_t:CDS:2 [Paraglomus brasilianum]